ncbi:hypothetical protein HYV85_03150 [Candidatus Woesearchaeota archaeon]|nr:hypothetical protein [Candidatus Woesearchaeota archaeon]
MTSQKLDTPSTLERMVAAAPTTQHRSIVQRPMRFLKEHKMIGYFAVSGLFAPVATGISYLAGLHLPVDEIGSRIGLQSSSLGTAAVTATTSTLTTALMLSQGVPYGIAVLTNGTATSPANYAAKFFLYHLMVLKENPWPKIESVVTKLSHSAVERLSEAKDMAAETTKALAYQLMTYISVGL